MNAAQFRRWMQDMGFTHASAADELGLSPRQIAYYRSGEQEIPKSIELACAHLKLRKEQK